MHNYDFLTLSPDEFQQLCQDLLQKTDIGELESFKSGKDNGIDLRHTEIVTAHTTIVQCKRYAPDSYKRLLRDLRNNELPKVKSLAPDRYVIATSVPLSPHNKNEILSIFKPYCLSTADIYGNDDLNGLLRNNQEIEKRHIKLWLSSTAIMEKILNADVFNITNSTIQGIKREISKIVIHPGVDEAREILKNNHHVVLIGLPGVGKTTVANLLLAERIEAGDTPLCVTSDISEAWKQISTAQEYECKKFVIHYDDFLGQTAIDEKFNKNEERKLSQLINAAKTSSNIKVILTTRDYILEQAKNTYEVLAREDVKWAHCSVKLEQYSNIHRAKILFNHLYFSNIEDKFLVELTKNKTYAKIINHSKFNPRVIAEICSQGAYDMSESEFCAQLLEKLQNPIQVWQKPFDQLKPHERLVLYVLATFKDTKSLKSELIAACKAVAVFFGTHWDVDTFDKVLRVTEGTFTLLKWIEKNTKKEPIPIITFHNPSITDFMLKKLESSPELIKEILKKSSSFSQFINIINQRNSTGDLVFSTPAKEIGDELADIGWKLLALNADEIFHNAISTRCKFEKIINLYRALSRINIGIDRLAVLLQENFPLEEIKDELPINDNSLDFLNMLKTILGEHLQISLGEKIGEWLQENAESGGLETEEIAVLGTVSNEMYCLLPKSFDYNNFEKLLEDSFHEILCMIDDDALHLWSQALDDNKTLLKNLSNWSDNSSLIQNKISNIPHYDDSESYTGWSSEDEVNESIDGMFSNITQGR